MKKYIIPFIVFFCIINIASINAQEIVAGYSLGYGTYQLDDVKKGQETALKMTQSTFPKAQTTETFPDGLFQEAYMGVKFSLNEIGLQYNYYSTGGRIHLADYSGEMKLDQLINGNAIGLYYKFHFISVPMGKSFRFDTNAGLSAGVVFNEMKIDGSGDLYDFDMPYFESVESYKLTSTNGFIQPKTGVQFIYNNFVSLNLNAGYQFDISGKMEEANIQNSTVKVDWSGLRISAGIGLKFSVINK